MVSQIGTQELQRWTNSGNTRTQEPGYSYMLLKFVWAENTRLMIKPISNINAFRLSLVYMPARKFYAFPFPHICVFLLLRHLGVDLSKTEKFLLCSNCDSFIIFPIQDVIKITQKNGFLSVPCRRLNVSLLLTCGPIFCPGCIISIPFCSHKF